MAFYIISSLLFLASCLQAVISQNTGPDGPIHPGQPTNCNTWHTVIKSDTCDSVPKLYGINREMLLEWNPAVSKDCRTNFWLGNAYCVGIGTKVTTSSAKVTSKSSSAKITSTSGSSKITSTSGSSKITSTSSPSKIASTSSSVTRKTSTSSQNSTYWTREPIVTWNITVPTIDKSSWPPTVTQRGQPAACNRWHLVTAGETCDNIMNRYDRFITIKQLHEWNPELHEDCSGLYADYWICVSIRGVGSDSDLRWSTSTPDFTPPPPPTSHQPTVFPTANSSFSPVPSHGPMPANCKNFHQVAADENCNTILNTYSYITREQFFEWNPVLKGNCFGLWSDIWYCVGAFDMDYPMPPTVKSTPSAIPTNSPGDCTSWYFTTVDDSCDTIAAIFGTFKLSDFISWNPSVSDDCTSIKQKTWYCVGKAKTPTTRTDGAPKPTGPSKKRPTQLGISKDCSSFWLVSKQDSCKSIATANGINEETLKDLNLALDKECKGLKDDHYICVGVSSSMTNAAIQVETKTSSTQK